MSASAASTVVSAAQKASNFANQTAENARLEVLKEPLGFIKILQFFLALLAFAIAVNGSSSVYFSVKCDLALTNQTKATVGYSLYQGDFGYPYDVKASELKQTDRCSQGETPRQLDRKTITNEANNIKSSAEFFVFTGVMAFLYSLAFLVVYVLFRQKYNNIVFFPLIDFGCTCLFTLFWFAGSIAWSKAVSDLQNYTNPDNIIGSLKACVPNTNTCSTVGGGYPTFANVIVSCILGFGNLILWAGNIWFVLKETTWYKTRKDLQQQQQNVTNNPISANDVTISAHYNPNNKI